MTIIGTSVERLGAVARVTGAQQYAADIRIDNALHVKLVSLACAHARIVSVDRDEAARVPGVRGVFTSNDLPQPVPRYGPVYADRPMLASGETKFSGEPVAVVVADTGDAADMAAKVVRIEFEELPACCRSTPRSPGTLRSCKTPIDGPAIRWRPRTDCSSGSSAGAMSTLRRRISSSRTTIRFRW